MQAYLQLMKIKRHFQKVIRLAPKQTSIFSENCHLWKLCFSHQCRDFRIIRSYIDTHNQMLTFKFSVVNISFFTLCVNDLNVWCYRAGSVQAVPNCMLCLHVKWCANLKQGLLNYKRSCINKTIPTFVAFLSFCLILDWSIIRSECQRQKDYGMVIQEYTWVFHNQSS